MRRSHIRTLAATHSSNQADRVTLPHHAATSRLTGRATLTATALATTSMALSGCRLRAGLTTATVSPPSTEILSMYKNCKDSTEPASLLRHAPSPEGEPINPTQHQTLPAFGNSYRPTTINNCSRLETLYPRWPRPQLLRLQAAVRRRRRKGKGQIISSARSFFRIKPTTISCYRRVM